MPCSARKTVPRCGLTTSIDMPFTPCTRKKVHASRLVLIVQNGAELNDTASSTHTLGRVAFHFLFVTIHVFKDFECWLRETQFEQWHSVQRHTGEFDN